MTCLAGVATPALAQSTCPTPRVGVALKPYVSPAPLTTRVGSRTVSVKLGGVPRSHDFGGSTPFVNTTTRRPDIMTMLTGYKWPSVKRVRILGGNITNSGVPNRLYKEPGATITAYRAGDGVVAGSYRAQMSSFQVPADKRMVWDMCVSFGDPAKGKPWPMYPNGVRPVQFWELKAPGVQPSLNLDVDADPTNPNLLRIRFNTKSGTASRVTTAAAINGVPRGQPVHIVVDTVLDERSGGKGVARVSVNGRQIINKAMPTLTAGVSSPHQWFMGAYIYSAKAPESADRVLKWQRARLLTTN